MGFAEPEVLFYTQRVDKPGPMVNCMFYSLSTVLRWMGLDVPRDYGMTLREASGVPYEEHVGTDTDDTKRALRELLGWEPDTGPMHYGAMSDADLLAMLRDGVAAARVMVDCGRLPWSLKRDTVGSYDGGHAIAVARAYDNNDVFWMDPMGKPSEGYVGVRVPWADVRRAVLRNAEGKVKVTYGLAGSAIPYPAPGSVPVSLLVNVVPNQVGDMSAGAVYHPDTLRPVTQLAAGPVKIVGQTPDGRHLGVLVSTSRIPGPNPKVLLVPALRVSGIRVEVPSDEAAALKAELSAVKKELVEADLFAKDLADDLTEAQDRINAAKAALA